MGYVIGVVATVVLLMLVYILTATAILLLEGHVAGLCALWSPAELVEARVLEGLKEPSHV